MRRDPAASVWTAREFFDRLSSWALFADGAVRDDKAPLWSVAASLAALGPLWPRIAHDADDLRRALVHGGATASEIAHALDAKYASSSSSSRASTANDLRALFRTLAHADASLRDGGRVDGSAALSRAVARIERGEVPNAVRAFSSVWLEDVVDPSDLELRALIGLARNGVPITAKLPVDSRSRGLLAGVEPVLRALEAAHDATALELVLVDVAEANGDVDEDIAHLTATFYGAATGLPSPQGAEGAAVIRERDGGVELMLPVDEAAEARDVAGVVAAWRRTIPNARVAVALRTIDDAAARIADALDAHGIPLRLRRRPLSSAPAARLLLDVIALARDGAPRDRMLAALSSPALKDELDPSVGARVLRVLRLAAARSDVEDAHNPAGGYRHRLTRYRAGLSDEKARDDVDLALLHVERALAFAARIPQQATLAQHLDAIARLADAIFDDAHEHGCVEVRDVIDDARAALRPIAQSGAAPVSLAAFATLLERAFERAQGPAPTVDADDAVEILALPELWGREFDCVVVAGCVEGRLPKIDRSERLLGDSDRALVNGAVGRRVLRLIDDNPLEPSPVPRAQALEPLWMIGAFRAAKSSLLLSAPKRDGRGRELSPSVFLLEAERALASRTTTFARDPSPRAVAVRIATLRASGALDDVTAETHAIDRRILAHADLAKTMAKERARFFFHKRTRAWSEVRAPFAFAIDPKRVAGAFASSFGLTPERPLTPTRLEALAECRMHGFLQHVLKVDVEAPAGNAADARVLGTLAHAVMERFFAERKAQRVPAAKITDADRNRVRALVAEEAAAVVATGHLAAIKAQVQWLETALVRAVSMLARAPRVDAVEPNDFEVRIGVPDRNGTPAQLGSAPIDLGDGRTLYLGGIIDRVDEGPHARAVVDYKTASTGSIRRMAHVDTLFEKHFQLLLYLRILEHHRPTDAQHQLHGYLISLRDGTTSSDVAEVPDLRARVLDDQRDDGLAAGVKRVVLPILEGTLPPDAGDRCDECRLQRICRIPLAAEFAPDIDDVDEGGGV